MRLIVGLGNPGPKYVGTRHNAGREAAMILAKRLGAGAFNRSGDALVAKATVNTGGSFEPAEVILPESFMNLSGPVVYDAMPGNDEAMIAKLIVIQDDLDLPIGTVRISKGGGDGGHNGVASITTALGSPNYIRVRIGIAVPDKPRSQMSGTDLFVLSKFHDGEEKEKITLAIERAAEITEDVLSHGFEAAANRWNVGN